MTNQTQCGKKQCSAKRNWHCSQLPIFQVAHLLWIAFRITWPQIIHVISLLCTQWVSRKLAVTLLTFLTKHLKNRLYMMKSSIILYWTVPLFHHAIIQNTTYFGNATEGEDNLRKFWRQLSEELYIRFCGFFFATKQISNFPQSMNLAI